VGRTKPRGRPHTGLSAGYFPGLDARGADIQLLGRATHERANRLDIGIPATGRTTVRVRDAVAEARTLAADVTIGSHGTSPRDSMMMMGELERRADTKG
jgi:hypothetical protein